MRARVHTSPAHAQTLKLWGLDGRSLHDRLWLARGLHVVRRGCAPADAERGATFLLLNREELVEFDVDEAIRALGRLKRGCMRLRIIADAASGYAEVIERDDTNRLVAIRRRYRPAQRPLGEVMLTRDRAAAVAWGSATDRRGVLWDLRVAAGPRRQREHACAGRMLRGADPEHSRAFLHEMLGRSRRPGAVCADVREIRPGLWIHRTSHIEPGARLIGPVWIGAGVMLGNEAVIIGPAVLGDRRDVDPSPPPAGGVRATARKHPPAPAPRPRALSKRLFDIVFSVGALTLSAPLFPLIMLAIWLEDGRPLFFAHRRQTYGGREFVCYKFRTMCKNAERLKARLAEQNICDGPQFHIKNDPRLLRTGRLLRKFHLDELPQFYNVLLGHMHIVGPRPSPDDENQYCPAWREARLSVKPGMTGLWQVSRTRAPNTDFQEWIRYDLEYVQRQNWLMDLWIVCRTMRTMLAHAPLPRLRRKRRAPRATVTVEAKPASPATGERPLVMTKPATAQPPGSASPVQPGAAVGPDHRAAA